MRIYVPRIADQELDARLAAAGAVLIEGPRACGKTETARKRAASEVLLDVDANAQRMATLDPRLLLDGAAPRLIDEWQVAPTVWNHTSSILPLAVAALGADPERLLAELEHMGFLLESLVYRDLGIYANASDAQVFHYRDNTMAVDAVVQNRRGDWCAFEVKLGIGQADAAAAALLKLHERVDTRIAGEPKALGVIVGTGAYAYRRPDGILVVPLAALGP